MLALFTGQKSRRRLGETLHCSALHQRPLLAGQRWGKASLHLIHPFQPLVSPAKVTRLLVELDICTYCVSLTLQSRGSLIFAAQNFTSFSGWGGSLGLKYEQYPQKLGSGVKSE